MYFACADVHDTSLVDPPVTDTDGEGTEGASALVIGSDGQHGLAPPKARVHDTVDSGPAHSPVAKRKPQRGGAELDVVDRLFEREKKPLKVCVASALRKTTSAAGPPLPRACRVPYLRSNHEGLVANPITLCLPLLVQGVFLYYVNLCNPTASRLSDPGVSTEYVNKFAVDFCIVPQLCSQKDFQVRSLTTRLHHTTVFVCLFVLLLHSTR